MKPSILELQLEKEAALKEIEDSAILAIETEIQKKISNRSEHHKAMRVAQVQRARARKKELQLLLAEEYGIIKSRNYRTPRASVIIKKPIEAVDKFKKIS